MYNSVGDKMFFSCEKGEFDQCFNRFNQLEFTGNQSGRLTRPVSNSGRGTKVSDAVAEYATSHQIKLKKIVHHKTKKILKHILTDNHFDIHKIRI